MDDNIRAMREGMVEREARSSQLHWYLLLGTVVLVGAGLGLAWAFLAGPPAQHPAQLAHVAPAAPVVAKENVRSQTPAAEPLTEVEKALQIEAYVQQQRDSYTKTLLQLGACIRHDRSYSALRQNYVGRNKAVFENLELERKAVKPVLDAHRRAESKAQANRIILESMIGRADTITAMFEDIETEISKFDQMDADTPLNATECAEFRTFVQSGRRDLKPL